jgi:hypothetical protein
MGPRERRRLLKGQGRDEEATNAEWLKEQVKRNAPRQGDGTV